MCAFPCTAVGGLYLEEAVKTKADHLIC